MSMPMKFTFTFTILVSSTLLISAQGPISLSIQPYWQELEAHKHDYNRFGGKWILAGNLLIRKRSAEQIFIEHLTLSWHGDPLEKMTASLYKKPLNKEFIPIEQYLVCDSCWQQNKQKLHFVFPQPISLDSVTMFYLVLTVPPEIEHTIRRGQFELEPSTLPFALQECVKKQNRILALDSKKHSDISNIQV